MSNRIRKNIIEICTSFLIAGLFLFITYWTMNIQIPVSAEKVKLQLFEAFRQSLWPKEESTMTDSIIMIDTHYDQQFVMEKEVPSMLEKGLVPVVDRGKLLRCLEYLKQKNDYKYILLDIFLDKAVMQDADSTLYKTIASMPRIVIAKPHSYPIADSCLTDKVGTVQYRIALWENDFVKFPYVFKGDKSLPLMMYEDVTGSTIKKVGPFYWDKGLARRSVILTYDYVDLDERAYLGGSEDYPIENDLEDTNGKYILIGDFVGDLHNTFLGEIPGTLINFHAYLALLHGHHRIGFGILSFLFVVFALPIYFKITNNRIPNYFRRGIRSNSVIDKFLSIIERILTKPKKIRFLELIRKIVFFVIVIFSKLLNSWVGYPLYLSIVCLFTYIAFNEAYDILITTALFYLLSLIWDSYQYSKLKS